MCKYVNQTYFTTSLSNEDGAIILVTYSYSYLTREIFTFLKKLAFFGLTVTILLRALVREGIF